jgi:cell division septum initiation protein DivIVA
MADYLDKYVERVADVPAQLQRCFALIRNLDQRSAELQADVDAKCRSQLAGLQPGKASQAAKRARLAAESSTLSAEIAAGQAKVVSFAEEKVCNNKLL